MGYYLQAVVGNPEVWRRTFGSGDRSLAKRLWNHEDRYIRYLVGNGRDDGRDQGALRAAMEEYIDGNVTGEVARDYLATIAHAVMRDGGTPVQTGDVSVSEAMKLVELLGDAVWLCDSDWPIPIGPTEWNLVGIHDVDTCRAILERADAWAPAGDDSDFAVEAIRDWVACAVAQEQPLILFAS